MSDFRRFLLLLISATISISVTIIYAFFAWPAALEAARTSPFPRDDPAVLLFIIETCALFIGVVYGVGRALARRIGEQALATELAERSRLHMAMLHCTVGIVGMSARIYAWSIAPAITMPSVILFIAFALVTLHSLRILWTGRAGLRTVF